MNAHNTFQTTFLKMFYKTFTKRHFFSKSRECDHQPEKKINGI
jgi:hypothetical protein